MILHGFGSSLVSAAVPVLHLVRVCSYGFIDGLEDAITAELLRSLADAAESAAKSSLKEVVPAIQVPRR